MEIKLIDEMYNQESYYWWHKAKRNIVQQLIKNKIGTKDITDILDIGCGTGKLMEELSRYGNVYGIDTSGKALNYCKKRGLVNVYKCELGKQKLPFKSDKFSIVTCLDVIEHIEDENDVLLEINRVLKPGGHLVITVPAYQFLFSYWDQLLHHKRRYTTRNLKHQTDKVDLSTIKLSYFNSFLLPPAVVFRTVKSATKKKTSDFVNLPVLLNNILYSVSTLEAKLVLLKSIPFGLSIIGMFQKKSK